MHGVASAIRSQGLPTHFDAPLVVVLATYEMRDSMTDLRSKSAAIEGDPLFHLVKSTARTKIPGDRNCTFLEGIFHHGYSEDE